MKHFSNIDHFFISKFHPVIKAVGLEPVIDYRNFSDHLPIVLSLNWDVSQLSPGNGDTDPIEEGIDGRERVYFDWKKANLNLYYDRTRVAFEPIWTSITALAQNDSKNNIQKDIIHTAINDYYLKITSLLKDISSECIPVFGNKKNSQKFWWDEEMKILKQASITTHQAWVSAGKPRQGICFDERNKAKYKYRWKIKNDKKSEKLLKSSSLQDKLKNKNKTQFWKLWNSKFKVIKKQPTVDGLRSNQEAAEYLANKFKETCKPNSTAKNEYFKTKFEEMCSQYKNKVHEHVHIDIDNISTVIMNLELGKPAGFDGITVEHLKFSHPCVLAVLKILFNLILEGDFVPDDFARGITIPIPKDRTKTLNLSYDDVRGITINPVISKIFECCLLTQIQKYLISDKRQFGFKKGIGCCHAIHMVKSTVDYYVNNGSTVTLGCLDLSKAFDKVNHFGLLWKLLKVNMPFHVVLTLANWFSKASTQVLWNKCLSKPVSLVCGLRQGSVLSPSFFSLYVDDLLSELTSCNFGCYIGHRCINSFMYADDIILLSISNQDMLKLVHLCIEYLSETLDLPINIRKCQFLRVGPRFDAKCAPIQFKTVTFDWVHEIRYLGIFIVSCKKFNCNYSLARKKFFRAFNSIYEKVGDKNSVSLLTFLLATQCVPILLYGIDAAGLDKYEFKRLCYTYDRAFMKIFNSFDAKTIVTCQWYSYSLDFRHLVDLNQIKYLFRIKKAAQCDTDSIFAYFDLSHEQLNLLGKYQISLNDSIGSITSKINDHFEDFVNWKI